VTPGVHPFRRFRPSPASNKSVMTAPAPLTETLTDPLVAPETLAPPHGLTIFW